MDINFMVNTLIATRNKQVTVYSHMRRFYKPMEVTDLLTATRRMHGYSQLVRHHIDAAVIYLSLNDYEQGVTQVKTALDIILGHSLNERNEGTDELCALLNSVLDHYADSVETK